MENKAGDSALNETNRFQAEKIHGKNDDSESPAEGSGKIGKISRLKLSLGSTSNTRHNNKTPEKALKTTDVKKLPLRISLTSPKPINRQNTAGNSPMKIRSELKRPFESVSQVSKINAIENEQNLRTIKAARHSDEFQSKNDTMNLPYDEQSKTSIRENMPITEMVPVPDKNSGQTNSLKINDTTSKNESLIDKSISSISHIDSSNQNQQRRLIISLKLNQVDSEYRFNKQNPIESSKNVCKRIIKGKTYSKLARNFINCENSENSNSRGLNVPSSVEEESFNHDWLDSSPVASKENITENVSQSKSVSDSQEKSLNPSALPIDIVGIMRRLDEIRRSVMEIVSFLGIPKQLAIHGLLKDLRAEKRFSKIADTSSVTSVPLLKHDFEIHSMVIWFTSIDSEYKFTDNPASQLNHNIGVESVHNNGADVLYRKNMMKNFIKDDLARNLAVECLDLLSIISNRPLA